MKPKIIKQANKITLRVPKLKKGTDSKLLFKKISDHPLEVEIIYANKSLGRYTANNINEIILLFFKKLAELNNGTPEKVEENLEKLQKTYLVSKDFVDKQLVNADSFSYSQDIKKDIKNNFISYPMEYSNIELFEYTNIDTKYIIGLAQKQNIIQFACDKYDLRLKDLADSIGVTEGSLRTFTSSNKISKQVETAIQLYIENIELKEKIKELQSIQNQ